MAYRPPLSNRRPGLGLPSEEGGRGTVREGRPADRLETRKSPADCSAGLFRVVALCGGRGVGAQVVVAAVATALDRTGIEQAVQLPADRDATSAGTTHARGDSALHIPVQGDCTQAVVGLVGALVGLEDQLRIDDR